MPNIATVLKTEIARVARKEARSETQQLKKTPPSTGPTLQRLSAACWCSKSWLSSSASPPRPGRPQWRLLWRQCLLGLAPAAWLRNGAGLGCQQPSWPRCSASLGNQSTSGKTVKRDRAPASCRRLQHCEKWVRKTPPSDWGRCSDEAGLFGLSTMFDIPYSATESY